MRMILIAAVQLMGGAPGKSFTIEAGAQLSGDDLKRLGLTDAEGDIDERAIDAMIAKGQLIEQHAALGAGFDADVVDGISRDEFVAFLARHGIAHDPSADIEALLAIEPQATAEPLLKVEEVKGARGKPPLAD